MSIINPMTFNFILRVFEASAVIKLRFLSIGDVWSVISFFLAVLGIYFIRQKFSYVSLIYKKSPFVMKLILMMNINKIPEKIENVNDDGNK